MLNKNQLIDRSTETGRELECRRESYKGGGGEGVSLEIPLHYTKTRRFGALGRSGLQNPLQNHYQGTCLFKPRAEYQQLHLRHIQELI